MRAIWEIWYPFKGPHAGYPPYPSRVFTAGKIEA